MDWYIILALISLFYCIIALSVHLYRIVKPGKPVDFSTPIGEVSPAVKYSFTGGMNPKKKESAYLHLPTYTAGILYHLGTFLTIALFLLFLFTDVELITFLNYIFSGFLTVSGLSGLGILVKRMLKNELRVLSNSDDYISNILVTGFHFITILFLINSNPFYYIWASALLLYLPLGKLRHTLYFFAARYHLGFFYGRRGVWPPKAK